MKFRGIKFSQTFRQDYRLYIRDFFFFLLTCAVSIITAEFFLFEGQTEQVFITTRLFTYAYLIIPLTLVVMALSYSYRTQRIKKTGIIRSSIRYKLIIAFIFVSILPSIPIVLLSGDLIEKSIDGFFSIDIKKGLQAGNNIINHQAGKNRNAFLKKFSLITAYPQEFAQLEFFFIVRGMLKKREYLALESGGAIVRENFTLLKKFIHQIDFQKLENTDIFEGEFGTKKKDYQLFKVAINAKENIIIGKIFEPGPKKDVLALRKTIKSYNNAEYFRAKVSFASQLGLIFISLILVLSAVVVSFTLARQISEPILRLAFATKSISQGDHEQLIDFQAKGEMGVLIESFNQMVFSLKNYKDQIKQSQRLIIWKEVAQRVAHEIKNPLTPIQLNAERIKRKFRDYPSPEISEFATRAVDIILQEVSIIKRLVNEFSQFARMPTPKKEMCNINEIFKNALESFHSRDDIRFQVNYDMQMPEIPLDRGLMFQVFTNLLKNSIEAMDSGDHPEAKYSGDNPLLREKIIEANFGTKKLLGTNFYFISLEDSAPSIRDEIREKIFEPYYSTKRDGTGIGLAISEKIVADHGGTISVEKSKKYTGLKFTIRFEGDKM